MATIKNIEFQSYTLYFTAIYTSKENKEYEIVFYLSGDENIPNSIRELAGLENEGKIITPNTENWKEIEENIQELLSDELLWTKIKKHLHENFQDS